MEQEYRNYGGSIVINFPEYSFCLEADLIIPVRFQCCLTADDEVNFCMLNLLSLSN